MLGTSVTRRVVALALAAALAAVGPAAAAGGGPPGAAGAGLVREWLDTVGAWFAWLQDGKVWNSRPGRFDRRPRPTTAASDEGAGSDPDGSPVAVQTDRETGYDPSAISLTSKGDQGAGSDPDG